MFAEALLGRPVRFEVDRGQPTPGGGRWPTLHGELVVVLPPRRCSRHRARPPGLPPRRAPPGGLRAVRDAGVRRPGFLAGHADRPALPRCSPRWRSGASTPWCGTGSPAPQPTSPAPTASTCPRRASSPSSPRSNGAATCPAGPSSGSPSWRWRCARSPTRRASATSSWSWCPRRITPRPSAPAAPTAIRATPTSSCSTSSASSSTSTRCPTAPRPPARSATATCPSRRRPARRRPPTRRSSGRRSPPDSSGSHPRSPPAAAGCTTSGTCTASATSPPGAG